ncbi:ComEC/Rec2 family competence protein [Novosphingobium sp. M1R2S20]|uniref:ComEC/Rec2 family competence protein n=1 Tax=Novosphingobium rhizovicinum TaxID=3228928 RepID=A0ABV3R6H9_9SPHN
MATRAACEDILPQAAPEGAALQHRPWNSARRLSRGLEGIERFLAGAGFDRVPWLAVAFGIGIAIWFALPSPGHWLALMVACAGLSASFAALLHKYGRYPYLRLSGIVIPLVVAAGCGSVWARSHLVGAAPIPGPVVVTLEGRILSVEVQPAQERSRLVMATREPGTARPIRVRINLPDRLAPGSRFNTGDLVRVRARLMPPAPPMLPGAYNFARTAWFKGLAATGTALSAPEILRSSDSASLVSGAQRNISAHVRARLDGGEAGIAAALATGDTGGIPEADAQAMRDAGLAHLLSISGLHVSAVIGAVYFVALKLLAFWPWLTLRVRLPVVGAGFGALAGIAYTLLTGAQVPTVRSCIGALLVLIALAIGREPLSLRMLAIAAFLVMLLWPEALMGPSFQMSFAAVLAIIALSGAGPIRRFLAPREEGVPARALRHLALVLLTGLVIEFALMPIGLYHFHRAGICGAFANVVAIPLTTLVVMPALLLALLMDLIGLGAPFWWIAGEGIAALNALAHWIASRPGAVTVMPAMAGGAFSLFIAGGLWLGLWSGKIRWFGLAPAVAGVLLVATARPPDLLISGDGRHVGLLSKTRDALFVLRETRSDFVRDNLLEIAGMQGTPVPFTRLAGANCNSDACVIAVQRGSYRWHLLLTRGRYTVPERALAAVCERVDIVISDRWLPRSCRPRWLKADRRTLARTGGLAIDLAHASVMSVAEGEGQHGWWRSEADRPRQRERTRAATAGVSTAVGE